MKNEKCRPDATREQPPDVDRLIADFAERVPDVLHALVVSSDGVPLAGADHMQAEHAEQLSAITSGLISLADGAARLLGCGAVTQALVAMQLGTLVIMAIDDAACLAVLTTAADLDLVAYEMTMLVELAESLVTPTASRPGPDAPS